MRKPKPKTILGKKIVSRCNELGIRMAQLERNIGMKHGQLTMYSNGHRLPSEQTARRIEDGLKWERGTIKSLIAENDEENLCGHTASKRELKVLAAWNRGDRTPEEVAEITGYTLEVVGMYLPIGDEA